MSKLANSIKTPNLKIIFFGNTKYSTIGLKAVNSTYPISLVITIPNSPVKIQAEQLNIPILETESLNEAIIYRIAQIEPDFLVVEDYGKILPKSLLKLPRYAPLNIHHSLLPKYRGPAPAPAAILAGENISGVTVIKMDENIDTGNILAQIECMLSSIETTDSLLIKLNNLGASLISQVIKQYLDGSIKETPQNTNKASYTKHFVRQDGYFDINNPPQPDLLDRMIRAYYPWPGVWTKWNNKIIKFLPHEIIQMEGKKAISYKDFINGYPNFPYKI